MLAAPRLGTAGFYYVTTAAYGAEPSAVQFELEEPLVPTRTAKPKPEKDSKKSEKKQDQQAGDNDGLGHGCEMSGAQP